MKTTLFKSVLRNVDPAILRNQIRYGVKRCLSAGRGNVWDVRVGRITAAGPMRQVTLSFVRHGRKVPKAAIQKQKERLLTVLLAAVRSSGWSTRQAVESRVAVLSSRPEVVEVLASTDPRQILGIPSGERLTREVVQRCKVAARDRLDAAAAQLLAELPEEAGDMRHNADLDALFC